MTKNGSSAEPAEDRAMTTLSRPNRSSRNGYVKGGPGRKAPGGGRLPLEGVRPSRPLTISWRGHGGAPATPNSVVFDKQLDKISLWLEEWGHDTRCLILDRLLRESSLPQLKLLWTVMQPALHRDFMYTANKHFPREDFTPISTPTGREVLDRMYREQTIDFHRIQSAHLQMTSSRATSDLTLPMINGVSPTSTLGRLNTSSCCSRPREGALSQSSTLPPSASNNSPSRMSKASKTSTLSKSSMLSKTSTLSKSSSLSRSTRLSRSMQRSRESLEDDPACAPFLEGHLGTPLQRGPPCIRFIEMPIRRHMQEESNTARSAREHVTDDVTLVGDPAVVVAACLPHRSQLLVPVFTPSNLAPPTDTKPLHGQGRIRFKVKVKVKGHSHNTFDPANGDAVSSQTAHILKEDSKPGKIMMSAVSVDIPPEGWQLLHWYATSWNELQRNEFLHKFLIKMDQRQHYYLSSLLSVKHFVDIVGLAPERLALGILSYLSPSQLVVASRVNKRWYQLCNNNSIWKLKCQEITLEIPVTSPNPNWKAIYKDNKSIMANWKQGNCEVVECKGHHDKVLSLTLEGNRMATGSADRTIRVWDVVDGRCLQTLRGHLKGVWAVRFFTGNLLLSASYDTTIRVWSLREGTCLRALLGHEGPVWAMERAGNLLVSASQDGTAKVWDISRCIMMRSLRGHGGPVFCVDVSTDGTLAVTGSSDRTVRLWDTQTGRPLKIIWVSANSVMAVSICHGWFACSHGTCVSLYSREGKLQASFDEHAKRVECLELKIKDAGQPSGTIISAGQDGVMKQWDIARGECTKTFEVSKSQVNCIHFDDLRIASASYDNKIKIWDFTKVQAKIVPR